MDPWKLGHDLEIEMNQLSDGAARMVHDIWTTVTYPFIQWEYADEWNDPSINWEKLIKETPRAYNRLVKTIEYASQYPEQLANIRAPPGSP